MLMNLILKGKKQVDKALKIEKLIICCNITILKKSSIWGQTFHFFINLVKFILMF